MGDKRPGKTDRAVANEREKLEYMSSMIAELRDMANSERIGVLTYILEMATSEIEDILAGGYQPARVRRLPLVGRRRGRAASGVPRP
jgi:hypothetical protein